MSNKRKKNIIIILCVLELFLIASTLISFRNRDINQYIASVSELDTDMFAIMVENDDGTYSQTKESTFPNSDIYKFNNELSGCIDYSGNSVKDALTYDEINNKVTATVSGTSYCYLYFDSKFKFKGDTLAGHLINNPGKYSMWYSGLEGDGHRFIGTNPNNYVCFGTSDKTECTSNPDNYMYRIIGVFDDGTKLMKVKLVKSAQLSVPYQYHDFVRDMDWNETKLYAGINNKYFYSFISPEWQTYIDNWKWTAVNTKTIEIPAINYITTTSSGIYLHEMNCVNKAQKVGEWTTPSAKIGLMYVSDYMLSLGKDSLYYTSTEDAAKLKTSWLVPASNEWTISRYGLVNNTNNVWIIKNDGAISNSEATSSLKLRPTFYMSEYVKYESGTGTIKDPIMITKPITPKISINFNKSKMIIDITRGENELDSYCINNSVAIEGCKWMPITETTITKILTEFGEYYVHVLDKEGYIGHSEVAYYSPSIAEVLVKTGEMWESGIEGDGYRFVGSGNAISGATPKNFICFGTSNATTCTGNPNNYMYRIIGVFPDDSENQYVKLVKYASMSNAVGWNDSVISNTPWENTSLFKNLNTNLFLNNTEYIPNTAWSDKIANWKWTAVNTKSSEPNAPNYYNSLSPYNIYLHEMNRNSKTNIIGEWTVSLGKISLMYVSDYALSLGIPAKNITNGAYNNKALLKTGWMHMSNNIDLSSDGTEWTMSRYGSASGYYDAWDIYSDGAINYKGVTNTRAIRPTFYLESNVQLKSGSGTIADPYIIEE